jgi:hypothetical protein
MKKLVTIIFALAFCAGLSAQKFSIFGNVTRDIFPTSADSDKSINGEFVFSLDAVASGPIWTFENADVQKSWLEGYGIALGYKHVNPDLESDWGVNIAYMNKVKFGEELFEKQGIAILPNYHSLVAGPVWFFGDKYPGVMVGGMITF